MNVSSFDRVFLIDMGYLLFYRYHATAKSLQYQGKDTELDVEGFMGHFRAHLENQLQKITKKYKLTRNQLFFCKDARQHTIWRKEIYPTYKGTRGEATELTHALKKAMYDVAAPYGNVLEVERLEADDIAYLCTQAIHEVKPSMEVYIMTSDKDLLQIARSSNVHVIDASFKQLKGITGEAAIDTWVKVLMGDKSDNIPAVCKGVGKKTAEKLAIDDEARAEFIKKKGCEMDLKRNELLIRFENIPVIYKNEFKRRYQFQ